MKAVVIKPYERPYENPIAVAAGERVIPDFDKCTDIEGWVWCTAMDGRFGWTPRKWLTRSGGIWRVIREFNAIELSVDCGELLEIAFEESGFFWATRQNGETGWVPCGHIEVAHQT